MIKAVLKKILKKIYPLIPFLGARIVVLRLCGYTVGKHVYLPADLKISDLKKNRGNLIIGDRVSMGPSVLIITDSSPNNSRLISKFPLISGSVFINNDVWLGAGVIVLPNVTIGECSVIGSGSLVTKDIPSYSVAAGIPAKVIKNIDKNEL